MTTPLDTEIAAAVTDELTEVGFSVSLNIKTKVQKLGGADPIVTDGGTFTVLATPFDKFEVTHFNGSTITDNTTRTYVQTSKVVNLDSFVIAYGKTWSITHIKPIYSGDDVAIWELGLD